MGCGGSDGGNSGSDFSFSADDQEHWVETWCELDLGMSRDEVIDAMGDPTTEFDADSGSEPQSNWEGSGASFTAFYDENGDVRDLYANELSNSPEVQADLNCPLDRQ